ncbi:MAG: hypothetical protein ACYC55_09135 [Candidatus Geothermincolia bacterium]
MLPGRPHDARIRNGTALSAAVAVVSLLALKWLAEDGKLRAILCLVALLASGAAVTLLRYREGAPWAASLAAAAAAALAGVLVWAGFSLF